MMENAGGHDARSPVEVIRKRLRLELVNRLAKIVHFLALELEIFA
jgi:ATP-dependent Clp protease ATP-binding subunit ClpA